MNEIYAGKKDLDAALGGDRRSKEAWKSACRDVKSQTYIQTVSRYMNGLRNWATLPVPPGAPPRVDPTKLAPNEIETMFRLQGAEFNDLLELFKLGQFAMVPDTKIGTAFAALKEADSVFEAYAR